MQIKTLIKDQGFVLKAPAAMPRIHTQICTSAAVCVPTPLSFSYPREQGGIKLQLCSWAGEWHILQLQGTLSSTENLSKLLLGHLRQGKRSGGSAGGTTKKQHLQREFCMWVLCSRSGLGKSPDLLQHTASLWSPSLNLATQNLNVPFSGYNTLFLKEGDKEA